MKIPRAASKYAGKALGIRLGRFGRQSSGNLRLVFNKKTNEFHINKVISTNMRVTPDITIPVNPETMNRSNPAGQIGWKQVRLRETQRGEVGNMSLRLAKKYAQAKNNAQKELAEIFGEVEVRAKGANSIYSKIIKMMRRTKTNITSDAQGSFFIQDAIGARTYVENMTKKDLVRAMRSVKVNGKNLTEEQQNLVRRVFENDQTLMPLERQIGENLAKPVKLLLAERQMEPKFQCFMLGAMQDAINRGVTTIEKLEQAGIDKNILNRFKTAKKIRPLRMTEVDNYKGLDGIPYFSDRHIEQFKRLQIATGEKFDIISCSEIDLGKYGYKNLPKASKDAIKKGGYVTGQINVVLSDGTYAEVQVRGRMINPIEKKDHVKYDSEQGKRTLGKAFDPYVGALNSLSEDNHNIYNTYMRENFNFVRNIELGSHINKPALPSFFNPILSIEEMGKIQNQHQQQIKALIEKFKPKVEYTKKKFFKSA